MRCLVLLSLCFVITSAPAWSQDQDADPYAVPPSVSTERTNDPGNGGAFWEGPEQPTQHGANPPPNYAANWPLSLNPGACGSKDTAGGVNYGLFIQEVSVLAGSSACDGSNVFISAFTYYEYAWVYQQPGLPLNFVDWFGTGDWDMSPGQSERGSIWKRGVAKFIPITFDEAKAWAADTTDKPAAVEAWEALEADGDWNRQPDGSSADNPVKDAQGDVEKSSPQTDAHSGGWPNRPDAPPGWDTDFGGTAQTITREMLVTWDYCGPDVGVFLLIPGDD